MKLPSRAVALAATARQLKNEPIVVANGAAGLLALAASFGLPISPDQKTELAAAFLGIANWLARSQTVAVNKLVTGAVEQSAAGQPVTIVEPSGATTTVGA